MEEGTTAPLADELIDELGGLAAFVHEAQRRAASTAAPSPFTLAPVPPPPSLQPPARPDSPSTPAPSHVNQGELTPHRRAILQRVAGVVDGAPPGVSGNISPSPPPLPPSSPGTPPPPPAAGGGDSS